MMADRILKLQPEKHRDVGQRFDLALIQHPINNISELAAKRKVGEQLKERCDRVRANRL
ncbi:hypothetical protein D3C73_1458780 [compost metagenome]